MRFAGFACLVTILSAAAVASPAAAQMLPMDLIVPPKRNVAPATAESAAKGFNLSAAPLPTSSFQRPEMQTARAKPAPIRPVNAEQVLAATAPVPPSRPTVAEAPKPPQAEPVEIAPKPIVTAAMGPVGRGEPLPHSAIVERANAFFTNLSTLIADFTQVGGDGRRMGGTLFLQRPGKVRFEYDPPATLEVIADGRSVAVRDKKLATQDLYSISQTPLKFLLREKVNLGQDIKITGITNDGDSVRINLEDTSTLGGTSRITLYFDPQVESLSQWRIVDPQGFQTVVVLNKVERDRPIDQGMFRIQYEAILGDNNR
ncbi:outer membrane lipoprotein carrier protein LolA [Microvirga roseola]|uniref:outer membrane lipoprotein carrier protein LolA n=1 Tax=Microvirga roseola TaxID=2883126 RepID=UPI001E3DD375|nr:outer membrane lipoprotein carrier protein LolA [Microvirga roseola]